MIRIMTLMMEVTGDGEDDEVDDDEEEDYHAVSGHDDDNDDMTDGGVGTTAAADDDSGYNRDGPDGPRMKTSDDGRRWMVMVMMTGLTCNGYY